MANNPQIPNYKPGVGRLVTDRYDFAGHYNGTEFRHTADQTDLTGTIFIDGNPYTTVEAAITALNSFANIIQTEGTYIIIPPGYDTYHNSVVTPDAPYDASVPALNTILQDILTDPNNPNNYRIRDGGVVFIPAGTYVVTSTILVPPGITLLGEGFGTKIINLVPGAPVFKIASDGYKGFGSTTNNLIDTSPDPSLKFQVTRETRITNMIICDNFLEPRFLGDSGYLTPNNSSSITTDPNRGLVSVQEGANFVADTVKFLGKVTYTSAPTIANNGISIYAINTDSTTPAAAPLGTCLNIRNCLFDAFCIPVKFTASGGVDDYFKFVNNYARAYGFTNNDLTYDPSNNCVLKVNCCNGVISENYFYSAYRNVRGPVYINASSTSPGSAATFSAGPLVPTSILQGEPTLSVHGNVTSIDKNNTGATILTVQYDPNVNSPPFGSLGAPPYSIAVMEYGNYSTTPNGNAPNSNPDQAFAVTIAPKLTPALYAGNTAFSLNAYDGYLTATHGLIMVSGNTAVLEATNIGLVGTTTFLGNAALFSSSLLVPSGSTINIQNGGIFKFDAANTTPTISQTAVSSGAGANLTISGQTTSASGQVGGDVILNSGASGTSINTPSAVKLQGVSVNSADGGALVVYPPQGTANSQRQINGVYQAVVHTLASGSDANAFFLYLPNSSAAFIEVSWIRRDTSAAVSGNKTTMLAVCDSGGSVTHTGPITLFTPASGNFDSMNVGAVDFAANTFAISVTAQSNANDWQLTINVNLM